MKKPSIPAVEMPPTRGLIEAVKANIEILSGRRNNKLTTAATVSAAPTQADFNALVAVVNQIISRLDS